MSSDPTTFALDGHPHCREAIVKSKEENGEEEVAWFFKIGPNKWARYSDEDIATLETQFRKRDNGSNKIKVPIVGGTYFANLLQLTQYKADDALRQRPMKRLIVKCGSKLASQKKGSGGVVNGEEGEKQSEATSTATTPAAAVAKAVSQSPSKKKAARQASPERIVDAAADDDDSNAVLVINDGHTIRTEDQQHKTMPNNTNTSNENPAATASRAVKKSRTQSPARGSAAAEKSCATKPSATPTAAAAANKTCGAERAAAANPYASLLLSASSKEMKPSAAAVAATTSTTAASTSMFNSRNAAAAEEAKRDHDSTATTIHLTRFAKSIFHVIVPTPNIASLAANNNVSLTVHLHSADFGKTSAATGVVAAGTYVPAGIHSAKHATTTTASSAQPSDAADGCFTLTADVTYRSQLQLFSRLLKRVPLINRSSLADSAAKCRPATRNWLKQIGRAAKFKGVFLMLEKPLKSLPPAQHVQLTENYGTTIKHLQTLASRSHLTVVGAGGGGEGGGAAQLQRKESLTDIDRNNADSVLIPCTNQMKADVLSDKDHLQTQLMMLSGPVLMLVDNDFTPVKNPPEFIACSIPGINFAYSSADQKAFCVTVPNANNSGAPGLAVNEVKAVERMRLIWAHTLAAMDSELHKVEVACLCAIGCGAFKGYFGPLIPRLWGRALALALTHFKQDLRDPTKFISTVYDIAPYKSPTTAAASSAASAVTMNSNPTSRGVFNHLESVIVSLPTFGADDNFHAFSLGLRTTLREISAAAKIVNLGHLPILLVEDASMTTTASYCAAIEKKRVGILNPSDVQAIRHGWVGMYWDGGHVALEELLAMTTTLLVQHVGLDRELFTDGTRRSVVSL